LAFAPEHVGANVSVKPVRVIVGTAAGGGRRRDFAVSPARKLSEKWGQQVVVENRAGAGGAVGSEAVAKAPADGYTLLTHSISYAVIPSSHRNLSYDPVRDLTPITVLVNAAQQSSSCIRRCLRRP
jgi:tripartite-type tricarboxylate transporter receptor subunit TctC